MGWKQALIVNDFQELMSNLTERERQVCDIIRREPDLTVNGIAHHVSIAARTSITPSGAKFHLLNVYSKLGVRSRAGLVALLYKDPSRNT